MSSDQRFLALRLEGPLQSWGFDSQYNRRNTGLMPTRSAVAGMCCAALGLPRGSDQEQDFLASFRAVRMTSIAIPRNGVRKELPVRRLQDYHTVQNTRRASGAINRDCVLTHRQYLTDAAFGVILAGKAILLGETAVALADPRWGLWLGRKTCIPSAPILAGLKDSYEDALALLIGDQPLESFTRQVEAENFAQGRDSLPDTPVSFATERRLFSPRRVITITGTGRSDQE
ncbi:MAG: type I-E CRISPR-associated protein Cas5/CasD [Syntrophobacterales bacterium]|nr:type I-E CRISPR-associated protein Cas5/CasD [Syntrophobacterales bacterium]